MNYTIIFKAQNIFIHFRYYCFLSKTTWDTVHTDPMICVVFRFLFVDFVTFESWPDGGDTWFMVIVISAGVSIVIMLIAGVITIVCYKRRKRYVITF